MLIFLTLNNKLYVYDFLFQKFSFGVCVCLRLCVSVYRSRSELAPDFFIEARARLAKGRSLSQRKRKVGAISGLVFL